MDQNVANADGSTYEELAQHIYSSCNAPQSRDQSLAGIRFAPTSFVTDVGAFLGHRAFHQQHHGYQHERQHGSQEKDIEISQRGCLLLVSLPKTLSN